MKKLIIILLLIPALCHGRLVRNVLKNGADNWFQNYNFNAVKSLTAYVDTVVLAGDYGDMDFREIYGIAFVNDDTGAVVNIRSMMFYPGPGRDVSVIGNRNPKHKYGIRISGSRFGFSCALTGNISFIGCEILGNSTGIKIVHDTLTKHALNYMNLTVTDNHVRGQKLEGMYIGASNSVGVFITGYVARNRVDSTGWDAIQCRVGQFVIEDNVCDSIGLVAAAGLPAGNGQDHGILIGSNTKSSIIRRNKLTNIHGYDIFNNGYAEQIIECNDLTGSIMVQSQEQRTDFQNTGYRKFIVRNNSINATGTVLFAYKNQSTTIPITVEYTNNRTQGTTNVQKGVVYTASNNTPTTVISCLTAAKEIFKRFILYSDGSFQAL